MKSGIKKQKKSVFRGADITLIAVLSVLITGLLGFSGIIIWLVGTL
ncbi:MAG: hypothetical protein J7L76_02735 [Spirochaetaceae bacterium]|nr:hypothetical protein [Spirochaetaceae bacterium]